MRNIILLLFLLAAGKSFSQSEVIINTTTLFIAEGKYNDAEKYLDSILRKEPKSIDALMMKGNVVLNYALMTIPAQHIITPADESIFSKDVATLKDNIVIVPKATALKVEQLWKQCLAIDSTRLDIQKGLCSLYAMAMMKQELMAYLPVIKRSSASKGNDFAYTLLEYARLLNERGDKEGSYLIYKKIAELYPSVNGIWCQLSITYFMDNDLTHAREYAEKGMSYTKPDKVVCSEAIDIYSAIAEPNKVLAMLQKTDKDTTFSEYPFYVGISKYARHDTTWRRDLNIYLQQFHTAPDSNPTFLAAFYMMSDKFTNNYVGLMSLLNYNPNDFATRLITDRAMRDYKDSLAPYMISAQVLINDKQYAKANVILDLLTKKVPGENTLQYYYAFSLYSAGDYKTAIGKWTQYAAKVQKVKAGANSDTYLAAPYYFLGQSYLKSGNKVKAQEYFKLILAGKDDSKFAYMAKLQSDKLSNK